MGNICTICCCEVQDCCRDWCGCCPCRCCKTIEAEIKAQATIEQEIEKQEIPFGYSLLHAGVRAKDDTYTCPVLEVHRWKESRTQVSMNEASLTQRIALGGMQTERDTADRHLGPFRGAERRTIDIDEEITIIPVESIISIKYSSDVKKEETEHRNVRLATPPLIKLSCCQKTRQCCSKTFCCCCHICKRQVHNKPEQIITTLSNQVAERKILITIEYIRYSNIDTPSHLRVLSKDDQLYFYREKFHTDILTFHLTDNYDFEQFDFDLKRMRVTTLCRLVTQLKMMVGQYPDEPTLEMMISKEHNLSIGDPPDETMGRLMGSGRGTFSWEVAVPIEATRKRF